MVYQAMGVDLRLAARYSGRVSTLSAKLGGRLVRTAHTWLVRAYRGKYIWCADSGHRSVVRFPEVPLVGIGNDLGAIRYWGLAVWSPQFPYRREWSDTWLVLFPIDSQHASKG